MGASKDPRSDALLPNGKPTKFKATIPTCPERRRGETEGEGHIDTLLDDNALKRVPGPYLRIYVEFIRVTLMDHQLDCVGCSIDMYALKLPSLVLRALVAVKGEIAKPHESRRLRRRLDEDFNLRNVI